MAKKRRAIIIGAGPGGLAAGMLLGARGWQVDMFETKPAVGGRNSPVKTGEYTFELGPTFVMLPQVFDDLFKEAGKRREDYFEWERLDPMYRLRFDGEKDFTVYFDKNKLREEIKRLFPGDEKGYDLWLKKTKRKFDLTYRCLTVPYIHWYHYFRWKLLHAFPVMQNFTPLYNVLAKFFKHEEMRLALTFQSKYLGMSPWECPGAFSILSYVEHEFGVFHPKGGVYRISEAMAKVVKEYGGRIHLARPVKEIIVENGRAAGVRLADGAEEKADAVIMNADFAYGMSRLIRSSKRRKYTDKNLAARSYSCSTFMLYLGVSKQYKIAHHNIFFSGDYRKNIAEIFESKTLPADPSFYIHNPSVTDSSLAPAGKSTVYVLVPVPNLTADIDWEAEKDPYAELVLKKIEERTELKDIRQHIEVKRVITPRGWEDDAFVYNGAVFNLAHNITQMLYLRPHNRSEEMRDLYIVGGGTHPGSGLPTIIESGRIAARLADESVS